MSNMLTNSDIFQVLEQWAPKRLAYEWDRVGLQIGSYKRVVKKIMITLDVLEPVVDEAIENNVDLIIAHHPILFKPIKQLNVDDFQGRIVDKLLKHNITVYAAHTNLDLADGGVNDLLLDALKIGKRDVLIETKHDHLYKLAVFVPTTHLHRVMDALHKHGAGHIGNYSHCTFQTKGQGTFKPLEGTDPFIGKKNQLTTVDEIKVETIVEQSKLNKAIQAMVNAHPYEEVAYDIYSIENKGKPIGLGRIGALDQPMKLEAFSQFVKKSFSIPKIRVVGNLQTKIEKVAIVGGSGEKYIYAAKQKGADVLITGDMTFHVAQEAWQMGLSIIDPGHHIEKVMIEGTKKYLETKLTNESIEIVTATSNTEPFQFI